MNHDTWGRGGGGGGGRRVCSNNPDHKVGMLAQRILKMPSSIFLGVLELLSPNILTYLTRASEQGLTYTPGQCHRLIHKIVFKI